MNKLNEYCSRRAMDTLLYIKRSLMTDEDLAQKVANSGTLVVARHLDEIFYNIMKLETDIEECKKTLKAEVDENEDFMNLLGGNTVEMLSEDVQRKIRALVEELGIEDDSCD